MSAILALPTNIADAMLTKIADGVTGGTFSVDGTAVPTDGYFVGGAVPSLINPTRQQIIDFVETAGADYVGFWEDSETLALYIDAVDWTPSEAFARRLSELRSEIAYWDVKRSQEVRV
jgi:hypothetical protein